MALARAEVEGEREDLGAEGAGAGLFGVAVCGAALPRNRSKSSREGKISTPRLWPSCPMTDRRGAVDAEHGDVHAQDLVVVWARDQGVMAKRKPLAVNSISTALGEMRPCAK